MNKLFKLSSDFIYHPIGYQESIRSFKGSTEISFDLSEVHTEINPIIKIDIDFNDGSQIISKFYNFNNPDKIVEPINKVFHPDKDYQTIIYYPTFFLKFLSGKEYTYQCQLKMIKSSFYNDFSKVDISNVQFIDDTENSLFVTLNTTMGDILNIKIK
jgi:hypothetical protein